VKQCTDNVSRLKTGDSKIQNSDSGKDRIARAQQMRKAAMEGIRDLLKDMALFAGQAEFAARSTALTSSPLRIAQWPDFKSCKKK